MTSVFAHQPFSLELIVVAMAILRGRSLLAARRIRQGSGRGSPARARRVRAVWSCSVLHRELSRRSRIKTTSTHVEGDEG